MKNNKKTMIITFLILAIMVTASIVTTGVITANNQAEKVQTVFYRLPSQDESALKQMVLADPRIQELIKDKSYDFSVQGQSIKGQDWNLALGVTLKKDISAEGFNKWLDEGRTDKSVVEKYVGVLNVGYNYAYDISINANGTKVDEISVQSAGFDYVIPELTRADREKAVTIALTDPRIQELLVGKKYALVPDSVAVWHSSKDHQKIGAGLEIKLDKTYSVDYAWPLAEYNETKYTSFPYYQTLNRNMVFEVSSVAILVDFEKGSVVSIIPNSAQTVNQVIK
jgi:hypothetical protein